MEKESEKCNLSITIQSITGGSSVLIFATQPSFNLIIKEAAGREDCKTGSVSFWQLNTVFHKLKETIYIQEAHWPWRLPNDSFMTTISSLKTLQIVNWGLLELQSKISKYTHVKHTPPPQKKKKMLSIIAPQERNRSSGCSIRRNGIQVFSAIQ